MLIYKKKISSVQNHFKTLSYKCHFQNVTLTADMASGHSSHVFSFTSCMASIHHLIGWHAWLLPSSPWQCECPPGSHHHGNGSVPQQPSAWAECKPLNQNHHGNTRLPKHWATVCLRIYVCVCVVKRGKIFIEQDEVYHQALVMDHTLFPSYCFFFHIVFLTTFHCVWLVGGCHDVALS